MNKTNATMRCAICRRALSRAAALKGGQPVGRTCAINAGLLQVRARSSQTELDLAPVAPVSTGRVPCADTKDLFEVAAP